MKRQCTALTAAATILLAAACATAGQDASQDTMPVSSLTALPDPDEIPFVMEPGFVGQNQTCMSPGVKNVRSDIANPTDPARPAVGRVYYCSAGVPGKVRVDMFAGNASKPRITAYIDCPPEVVVPAPPPMPPGVAREFCKRRSHP